MKCIHTMLAASSVRWLGIGAFSIFLSTITVQVHAAPSEEQYIRLLQDSIDKQQDGDADAATRLVIDKSNKNDPADQVALGIALMRIRNHFAAIEVLTRATKLAPRSAVAFGGLGTSYVAIDNCEKAIPELAKAIEIDPKNSGAKNWNLFLGECRKKIKKSALPAGDRDRTGATAARGVPGQPRAEVL